MKNSYTELLLKVEKGLIKEIQYNIPYMIPSDEDLVDKILVPRVG